MRLAQWFLLIGLLMIVGLLQVTQQTAILLEGYALGHRVRQLHAQETQLSWLHAQVIGLSSPAHLAEVAQERKLTLVAWSTFSPVPTLATGPGSGSLVHLAANTPSDSTVDDGDTSD